MNPTHFPLTDKERNELDAAIEAVEEAREAYALKAWNRRDTTREERNALQAAKERARLDLIELVMRVKQNGANSVAA